MELDVVLLSRLQFALTIMFHYLFPPLTIGLGVLLVIMEGSYLRTGNPVYEAMTRFWVKIFALTFGLGVASGIVMEFQFGTNWAAYSRFVGDVFGSALAAEGIFAFFLESGFLAVLVFGWNKVSPKMHFFSTIMVSLGSMFSAVWIVIANSWQQTPAGYNIVDAAGNILARQGEPFLYNPELNGIQPRAEITSFWELVFNPSSVARISHTVVGAIILAGFVVMSVSAFYIIKNRHLDLSKRAFKIALVMTTVFSISQLFLGHWSAKIVEEHQPAKLAAFEGIFETEEYSPLYLFGFPDVENEKVYGIAIPGMLSYLVHAEYFIPTGESFREPVRGFDTLGPGGTPLPEEDRPPVHLPFQMYHIMIGLGMYFIGISLFASFLLWRGKLFQQKWLMWVFVFSVVLPYIANQAGWIAAEVGRQPWIVYNLLRTADGVSLSPAVNGQSVLASLILFTILYALLFAMYIYLMDRKIKAGPEDPEELARIKAGGPEGLKEAVTLRGPGQAHLAE